MSYEIANMYTCTAIQELNTFFLCTQNYEIRNALMFIGPCIILIVEYRETNLMSLALLFLYLVLNMFRMLIHPSSGHFDLFVELFHGLY